MTERTARINGLTICYEELGEPDAPPVLLIMGLGGPLIWWDRDFCEGLVQRGFRVIRYDNRDVGRSDSVPGPAPIVQSYLGRTRLGQALPVPGATPPYTLTDMADDAAGLLTHLGIARADVVGVSMGGMIAQILALRQPHLVRSLTSMMSSTGSRRVGWTHPRVIAGMFGGVPEDEAGYIARNLDGFRRIGTPRYREANLDRQRARAKATFDRGLNPAGTMRQLAAILAAPDRTRELRGLRIPTAVIHGTRDPLVHVSGGKATARAVRGAELVLISGMGHDLPPQLWPVFQDVIERTAGRAATATTVSA